MVGPISNRERQHFARKLKIGFVLLVALSGGLISLYGDASPLVALAATGGGVAVGVVLVWIAFPASSSSDREYRS